MRPSSGLSSWAVTLCWLGVLGSALATVYLRHETRNQFVALQRLHTERDSLMTEWGRLRLEQSTWASHARIERLARDKLEMLNPDAEEIAIVWP